MNNKFIKATLIIFWIFAHSNIYGQQPLIPAEVLSKSLLIVIKNETGSGFFMFYNDFCYLISARHVFYKQGKKKGKNIFIPKDSVISIASYPNDPNKTESNRMMVDLRKGIWNKYAMFDSINDIASIQIGKYDTLMTSYYPFVNKFNKPSRINGVDTSFCKYYDDIFIGNDVFLIGYPTSIGIKEMPQIDILKPLLRKGAIAGKNDRKKTVILDCPAYPGNSGGPVFEYDLDYKFLPVKRSLHFIGVVSEFVPFTQEWKNTRHGNSYLDISNSGYSIVVPYDALINLLKNYK